MGKYIVVTTLCDNKDIANKIINTLSKITGKKVTDEQISKIINTVKNNQVPSDLTKYYE